MLALFLQPSRIGEALSLLVALTGCQALETGADYVRDVAGRHPVVTGVGTAILVGGNVYAVDHHSRHESREVEPERPVCGRGAC